MERFVDKAIDMVTALFEASARWGTPTWCLLGFIVVFVGFILLRGNTLRGA